MSSVCGFLLLISTGVFSAPTDPITSQSVVLLPGRPVVVEIPPNSSVNVTVQQNPPTVIQNNGPIMNPDKAALATQISCIGTTRLASMATSTQPSSAAGIQNDGAMAGALLNRSSTIMAPGAPSIIGTPAPINNERNYIPAVMLLLGSEGPNANRESPLNAVLPFGATLDSAVSSSAISSERRPIVNQNRRVEMKFLDFQMNYTAVNQAINQDIVIAVKFIAGTVPVLAANEDLAVVPSVSIPNSPTIFHGNSSDTIHPNTTIVTENTAGFQEIFNGAYQTASSFGNKVAVQRVVTVEMCGQFNEFDRGYLDVSIKPASNNGTNFSAAVNRFADGYYKCVVQLGYAPAARESESYWSDVIQCNGIISATGYSYRLWFRTRQYVVDGGSCLRSKPVLDEHN